MEEKPFRLPYHSTQITVQRHSFSGQVVFRINFADGRASMIIHRALGANASRFWTSIPEGRQQEAEEIGHLITQHYNTKQ